MRAACSLAIVVVLASLVFADAPAPWPQFRGPGGSGIADNEQPPIDFGPDKNLIWKVRVPSGMSSPIVVGKLIVLSAFENEKLYTIAYERADGHEVWRAEAPLKKLEAFHKTEGSPAASTPATDGERIVSYFGSCGLVCYDLAGNELWTYELSPASMFGDYGTGVSPILVDGTVVLLRDEAREPKIMAFDAETGDLKWEQKRESRNGYCTPVVWATPQGKQVVAPGFGRMVGYDLKTGAEKWFVHGMPAACCASPVTADGLLFFAAWSPGDPSEGDEFKMPEFDEVLSQAKDDDGDGKVSRDEASDTDWASFFNGHDQNKDGFIERDEWNTVLRFIASSRNSAFALKPGGTGDVTQSHVVWKQTKGLPYVPTAIVYRGQHVMVKDGGIVTAYEIKSGKEIYQKRAIESGSYYASPVAANGHIYFSSLADGTFTVLKAGAASPEVAAKNPPLGERTAATPAIADDTLYVRTAAHLWAFAQQN